jgi:hypothetical protein
MIAKSATIEEAFRYPMTSVPLSIAAVRYVKPCNTYEDFIKSLVNATTPPKNNNPRAIEIVMDTYIDLYHHLVETLSLQMKE